MSKVSVIIPIYNAALHLKKCLDSVLSQTLTDYEVICVNDGSIDDTQSILEQYAKQDVRICLYGQDNQGVSSARNLGIEQVRGEYIAFVDADDWVEPDYLERLYTHAKKHQVLISICGHIVEDISGTQSTMVHESSKTGIVLTQQQALQRALLRRGYQGFLWNKLFHRSLFFEHGVRLDCGLHHLEDLYCVCQCLCLVEAVYYDSSEKYHYNQSVGSTYALSEKSETMLEASEKLIALFQKEQQDEALLYAKEWHCYSAGALYLYYAQSGNQTKLQYYRKASKTYLKEYMQIHQHEPAQLLRGLLIVYAPKVAVWLKRRKKP